MTFHFKIWRTLLLLNVLNKVATFEKRYMTFLCDDVFENINGWSDQRSSNVTVRLLLKTYVLCCGSMDSCWNEDISQSVLSDHTLKMIMKNYKYTLAILGYKHPAKKQQQ